MRKVPSKHEIILEGYLAGLKKEEAKRSQEDIPNFLTQFGIDELKLENGYKVTIKQDIACSLPKTDFAKRQKVLSFISNNGGGGMIKDTLTVVDPTQAVINSLNELGVLSEHKKDIHAASLKAFIRELLGLKKNTRAKMTVVDLPTELNPYVYSQTIIKGDK